MLETHTYLIGLSRAEFQAELRAAVAEALAQQLEAVLTAGATTHARSLLPPLGPKQAAEFLGVSRATIFAWVRKGLITCRKVGRRTLFDRETLLAAAHAASAPDGRRSTPRRTANPVTPPPPTTAGRRA